MSIPQNDLLVFYDGECFLCSRAIQFLLRVDKKKKLYFAAQQGDTYKDLAAEKIAPGKESIILFQNGCIYEKSSAVLGISKALPYPWKLLYAFIIIPRFIRDAVYTIIAKNRKKWFGARESCYLGSEEYSDRFIDKTTTQPSSP